MLSITKDIEFANGIKASNHGEFAFLTKDSVDDVYMKIINRVPYIKRAGSKNFLFQKIGTLLLVDENGVKIDVGGSIIKSIGEKYLLASSKVGCKIMDMNANVLYCGVINYCGSNVVSLRDIEHDQDLVVTPNTIKFMPINSADVVGSLEDGTFFIQEDNGFMANDSWGNGLEKSSDLSYLVDKYQSDYEMDLPQKSLEAFEKYMINKFKNHLELKDYDAKNLLDVLNKAVTLDDDFYIDLINFEVYKTKFRYLLKISDGKHSIWVPDTKEERAVMKDFCLNRRKENE